MDDAGRRHSRCSIVLVHDAPSKTHDALIEEWAACNAHEAHRKLSSPDVSVTNQSDKDVQLPKILQLDSLVRKHTPPHMPRAASRGASRRQPHLGLGFGAINHARVSDGAAAHVAPTAR